jgi:hypothetical protein
VFVAVVAVIAASVTFVSPASPASTDAPLTVTATSSPASGGTVDPGATVTYTLEATSLVAQPSGATVIDDLSGLLGHATVASTQAELTRQALAIDLRAKTLTWTVPERSGPGTANSVATATFQVVVSAAAPGGTKLTTAAAPQGDSCRAVGGCATTLTVAGAPPASSTTTTSTLQPPSQAKAGTTPPALPKSTRTTTAAPATAKRVVSGQRAAAADPPPICTGGLQNPGSVLVPPAPPANAFEMDGNLCLNNPANLDWANVGGQPAGSDGFNDLTQFTQGAKENNWPWNAGEVNPNSPTAGNALDIGNVYAFTQTVGGHVYTYFGYERNSTTGSAAYYVELNQRPNTPTGSLLPGPVPNRTTGDLRLVLNQTGSTLIQLVEADTWLSTGPTTGSWVKFPSTAGFTGAINQNTVPNLSGTLLNAGSFAEVAIDLTTLFPPAGCSGNFGTVNLRSASSPSDSSSLGDWVQPVAIAVPSTCATTTATQVINDATGNPPSGTEITGASFHDTATVGVLAGTPTGTLTYSLFPNGTCTAPASSTEPVTLVGGAVPRSTSTGPLLPGSYSFRATYNGDTDHHPSTSPCEPFTVAKAASSIATVVTNNATGRPPSGTETTGASFRDGARVTGVDGITPTGTVVYSFFRNGTCTAPPSSSQTVTLAGGAVPPSNSTGPLGAGSYTFQGIYSGDANYSGLTSPCEPFTVAPAASSTDTLVINNATGNPPTGTETTGASFHDTATVTGVAGFAPTGTVTYRLFHNGTCAAPVSTTQTVTLAGGLVPPSNSTGPLGPGSYSFEAIYSGDANHAASTSPCEPFTVTQAVAPTATEVIVDATGLPPTGSETAGTSFHDTATVTGADGITPTGTVTYRLFPNGSCTAPPSTTQTVTLAGGLVPPSDSTGPLARGDYSFEAIYSGDGNYAGSTSPCEPFGVGETPSSTATLVINDATGLPPSGMEITGASFHDTATVTGVAGITATGTVTYNFFTDGACLTRAPFIQTVTLVGGLVPPSNSTGPLGAGVYSFRATYSGDGNFSPSTSPCEPFTITPTTSSTDTLVINDLTGTGPSGTETTGASFHDTATVTGVAGIAPTGTVTYRLFPNGTCTAPASTSQTVTLAGGLVPDSASTGPLGAGSYSFQATYSGDKNYAGSSSPCEPFTIAKGPSSAATEVINDASLLPPSGTETTGAAFHDTATVTGVSGFTPTGTVIYSFFHNGTCAAPASTTQTVTLAGGAVPPSNSTGPLGAGSYSFQATYSGDGNHAGSTSPCEPFIVAPAEPPTATLVINDATGNPPTGTETAGASFHDTATVTGVSGFTPTGTVTYRFFHNGECTAPASTTQTVTLAGGLVPDSASTGPLARGNYSFEALYSGDGNYAGATSACEPFSVGLAPTLTDTEVINDATSRPPSGTETTGASFHDTATVTGTGLTPTGDVTYDFFTDGSCSTLATTQTVTLAGGLVPPSNSTGPLGAGSYSFRATYSGDSNHGASISPCEDFRVFAGATETATEVINNATSRPPSGTETTGASFHDTATVTRASGIPPTGTVTYRFFTNGDCRSPASTTQTVTPAGGLVPNSASTGPLGAGSYSFQATYSGDDHYLGSTSPCEPFTVSKGTSSTATVVHDAATKAPWTNTETTGASAFDTATVTGVAGVVPTGTVTYTLFNNDACTGTGSPAGTVTLTATGAVPNSKTVGPLAAGRYAFRAIYSGDRNYSGSDSMCEPFTVAKGDPTTNTIVHDASTNRPLVGTETSGTSAYDTASVTGATGMIPRGTVTYTFFTNGGCSGTGTAAGTVTLTATGGVPNSHTVGPLAAGSYSFRASYSGDANYVASTSACEPFTIAATPPPAPPPPITNVVIPVTG